MRVLLAAPTCILDGQMNSLRDSYRSPSQSRLIARLENKFLSADDSWWTGRHPLHTRVIAEVPLALYLNYLVRKSYVASLAPNIFRPLELPGGRDTTLFTILLFTMEHARPAWAPRWLGAFTPRIFQSNWRFYGYMRKPNSESRNAVLFVRTVTDSLALSTFGRRLARCFPLRRAHHIKVAWAGRQLAAVIEAGGGSAPELFFEGEPSECPDATQEFRKGFATYDEYAHWIIDQHLSVVLWPREYVVQDMHLDFQKARITPLRCLRCHVSGVEDFVPDDGKPLDCFVVENLRVFLDNIYAVRESGGK